MPGRHAYQDLCSLDGRTSINRLPRLAIRHKQGALHYFAQRPCFTAVIERQLDSVPIPLFAEGYFITPDHVHTFRSYCSTPFATTIESAHSLTYFPSSCDSKQRVCIWNIYSLNPH